VQCSVNRHHVPHLHASYLHCCEGVPCARLTLQVAVCALSMLIASNDWAMHLENSSCRESELTKHRSRKWYAHGGIPAVDFEALNAGCGSMYGAIWVGSTYVYYVGDASATAGASDMTSTTQCLCTCFRVRLSHHCSLKCPVMLSSLCNTGVDPRPHSC
jgi:hypothetical protein